MAELQAEPHNEITLRPWQKILGTLGFVAGVGLFVASSCPEGEMLECIVGLACFGLAASAVLQNTQP